MSQTEDRPGESPEVVVLGAGPAGLATALLAARKGLRVSVVERSELVGGLARSETVDGVRVDLGSHRLHPAAPPSVLALLVELLGEDLQSRPRNGRIHLEGRWIGFPLRAGDLVRRMPTRWLVGVARDAVRNPHRRTAPTSYAALLRARLGPTAYEAIYGPFARKLWGLPGEQIDVEQARVRVTADSVTKVAARVARTSLAGIRRRGAGGDAGSAPRGTRFFYPRRGFGQLCEALADAAREEGVRILLGCEVAEVAPGERGVVVRTATGQEIRAPRVMSTLPIPVLARLVTPGPPAEVVARARGLSMRAVVLVYLTHRPEHAGAGPQRWTPYDAHYLPSPATPVSRISEPANYRDDPDDPTDRSVVCAEIPCAVGDDLWRADDEELGRIVVRALATHDLPPISVAGVQVRRVPAVYPVYDLGFSERLAAVEDWAAGLPGVTTFGRAGLFAHDNSHHAMLMAEAAADCLGPGGTFDEERWARAREAFRDHVVED